MARCPALLDRWLESAQIDLVDFEIKKRSEYIGSPIEEIENGVAEVRETLERSASLGRRHKLFEELRADGITDYVAWPLHHTLGKRHAITFETTRAGGFEKSHIAALRTLLPAFALVSEIRIKNRLARTC